MSDAFHDRERGFEAKYELEQDQLFRIRARRDHLFGQWVAGQMGLSGSAATAYADEIVSSNISVPGDDDMLRKVRHDLERAGATAGLQHIHEQLKRAEIEASASPRG